MSKINLVPVNYCYFKVLILIVQIFSGLGIGCAMILGNFISMQCIKNVNKKLYQRIVAVVMIAVSLWLIGSNAINLLK